MKKKGQKIDMDEKTNNEKTNKNIGSRYLQYKQMWWETERGRNI